jgi:hypothetical protein
MHRTTATAIVAEDNTMQDWVADNDGEGQEQAAREGGDSGVAMMAVVAEDGRGGRQWGWLTATAAADNHNGGRQRQQMMTACKIKWRTTRGKEESGQQTTTALGQLGRECEKKIKKSSLLKKIFFSNTVCTVGVFAPA